jgi:hypothetical protein
MQVDFYKIVRCYVVKKNSDNTIAAYTWVPNETQKYNPCACSNFADMDVIRSLN